ncbi:hypothetical protein BH20PSE1_BH20PSE1_10040 [soil metagenome]
MEDILKLIGFAAAFGLVGVAMWQVTFAWQDPREETDGREAPTREARKKRGVQAQISRGAEPAVGEKDPSAADRGFFNSLRRWR